jgi:very-short-patch-repair endonuclease
MDKVEYLIKTFSRTKRKDFENYILNAIWQKIDCVDIRPVTQQYVKGDDNKYYLIDLYFPQINVGVEVDEAFHKKNSGSDLKRELTIEEKLSSVRKDSLFELKRIDATLPLQKLTKRIDTVSAEIKEKIVDEKITRWDTDVSIKEQIDKKGYVSVDDFYRFRLITDVANQLFFKNYRGYQQASFIITIDDELAQVWFPTISTKEKEEHSQWLNYLNEDWSVITEKNIREDGKTVIKWEI